MTTMNQGSLNQPSKRLPKHGPAWTFYAFTVLAVLLVIAMVVGFRIASMAHWY